MSLAIAKGLVLPEGSRFSIGAVPAVIAGVAPTLDFRPALERREIEAVSLTDKLTFTGGNQGTFVGSDGYIQRAQTNVPRFTHDPATRRSLGMTLEASRTNSIRNNTMVGAVAGTPGTDPTNWVNSVLAGITQQIIGTGTENGITYIDYKFSGTGTGATVIRFDGETQVVASSGQAWTGSTYVKLVAGSLTNLSCSLNMRQGLAAGGLVLSTDLGFTPTSAALNTQRIVNAVASMQATTERIINRIVLSSTGAIDITLRIGLPQLELGAFATSVIPTTTTALTRSADVASVNTLSPWYNATAGTIYAEAVCVVPTSVSFVAQFNDLTTSNFIDGARYQTTLRTLVNTGGVNQSTLIPGTAAGAVNKTALAYAANDIAMSANGAAALTDTSATIPTVTRLWLGDDGSGSPRYLNGYLRRITYYPVRLTNAQLQNLTA